MSSRNIVCVGQDTALQAISMRIRIHPFYFRVSSDDKKQTVIPESNREYTVKPLQKEKTLNLLNH